MTDIFCCACGKEVTARLTDGGEIYPHRPDLKDLPFYRCDTCLNYVGCHHKTQQRTKPLGNIPTKEIRFARSNIHAILDPLWKKGKMKRNDVYAIISERMGYDYHTAQIKDISEADAVIKILKELSA